MRDYPICMLLKLQSVSLVKKTRYNVGAVFFFIVDYWYYYGRYIL